MLEYSFPEHMMWLGNETKPRLGITRDIAVSFSVHIPSTPGNETTIHSPLPGNETGSLPLVPRAPV